MKKIAFSLCLVIVSLMAFNIALLAHAPPNTPPVIGTPVIQPSSATYSAPATVYVNVTDQHSGVQNVTIIYTTDNWKMVNTTLLASYNATTEWVDCHRRNLGKHRSIRCRCAAFPQEETRDQVSLNKLNPTVQAHSTNNGSHQTPHFFRGRPHPYLPSYQDRDVNN